MIGAYQVAAAGTQLDTGRIPVPLRITHGRSSAGTQPDAPICEFNWVGTTPPADIGDSVAVTAQLVDSGPAWIYDAPDNYLYDSAAFVYDNAWTMNMGARFTGRISGLHAHEVAGQIVEWEVRCIGEQASVARLDVLATRPAETDVARVQAIAAVAGFPIVVDGTPGVMLAADTLDRESALEAIQQVCESTGGLVWQDRQGRMHYGTADHRQTSPEWTLSAGTIVDGLSWRQDFELVINHVTVQWGPEDSQQQATHSDEASIAEPWGKRHVDITTMAATEADADQLALLVLARRAWPFWLMNELLADGRAASRADAVTLLSVDIGTMILLPATAVPGPTPAPWTAWVVEGWVEEATEQGTLMQLSVTDAARWAQTRLRTWDEARRYTWAEEAAGSWLDALVWEGSP